MGWPKKREVRDTGIVVRSGIEEKFCELLLDKKLDFYYEPFKIEGDDLNYIPDFLVEDKILVELKGRATDKDVKKGELVEDYQYIIVGDTDIERIPADEHFDFNNELEKSLLYILSKVNSP